MSLKHVCNGDKICFVRSDNHISTAWIQLEVWSFPCGHKYIYRSLKHSGKYVTHRSVLW
jgi:hypothetical protein